MTAPTLSQHAPMPRVAEVCGDDAEVLALSVARFVAAGYMTRDIACWDAAFDGAEALLGAEASGRFVAAVVGIVRALRAEREDDWSFMPATCCRLTGHECALVGLIGRGRLRLWDEVGRGAAASPVGRKHRVSSPPCARPSGRSMRPRDISGVQGSGRTVRPCTDGSAQSASRRTRLMRCWPPNGPPRAEDGKRFDG